MSSATIRPASSSDVPALARLGARTFVSTFGHLYRREDLQAFLETSRSEQAVATLLGTEGIGVWIAETTDGSSVGYVVAGGCKLPVDGLEVAAGEIRQLYVRSDWQNRGLGTRLLDEALVWLEARRHAPLYVGVWSGNHGAQRLYGRYGFERIGEYGFMVGEHRDLEFILRRSEGG